MATVDVVACYSAHVRLKYTGGLLSLVPADNGVSLSSGRMLHGRSSRAIRGPFEAPGFVTEGTSRQQTLLAYSVAAGG